MRIHIFAFIFALIAMLAYADPHSLTPYPVPKQAPDFKLQDVSGKVHALADYRGKVLIVNFWATWCPPCVREMPSLQRVWQQLNQEAIQVLAVNVGDRSEDIDEFAKKHPVSFPLLIDSDMAVATSWSVKGLPTTYILDPSGQIAFQVIGDRQWDDPAILQQVRALQER